MNVEKEKIGWRKLKRQEENGKGNGQVYTRSKFEKYSNFCLVRNVSILIFGNKAIGNADVRKLLLI